MDVRFDYIKSNKNGNKTKVTPYRFLFKSRVLNLLDSDISRDVEERILWFASASTSGGEILSRSHLLEATPSGPD